MALAATSVIEENRVEAEPLTENVRIEEEPEQNPERVSALVRLGTGADLGQDLEADPPKDPCKEKIGKIPFKQECIGRKDYYYKE